MNIELNAFLTWIHHAYPEHHRSSGGIRMKVLTGLEMKYKGKSESCQFKILLDRKNQI
jgi:hypothetical protein